MNVKVRTQLSQCGKLGEFRSNSAAVCSLHHKKEQNTLGHWQVCTRIFIHQIIKASIWLIGGDFVQLNKQPKKRSEAKRGNTAPPSLSVSALVAPQRRVCVIAASQSEALLAVSL